MPRSHGVRSARPGEGIQGTSGRVPRSDDHLGGGNLRAKRQRQTALQTSRGPPPWSKVGRQNGTNHADLARPAGDRSTASLYDDEVKRGCAEGLC